jgi:tRNA(Ile)-lysidine synthase
MGGEDIIAKAEQEGLSIEEAARVWRYRFLFSQARALDTQAVAVGHNADDQVETVLMHLLRGAGLSGLKGMQFRSIPNPWSRDVPLVRPLLGIWRGEISAYLDKRSLKPHMDRSNLDTRFFRNRLRHELIPYLEGYNPQLREIIWRTAEILAGDEEALTLAANRAWGECILEEGDEFVAFKQLSLSDQPLGLKRRLLRKAIERLRPGLRDVDFNSVERALDFLIRPSRSRQMDLGLGLRVLIEKERFYLAAWEADLPTRDWPQLPSGKRFNLEIPGTLSLGEGWSLRAVVEQGEDIQVRIRANKNPFQAWVDVGEATPTLHVRSRRSGERFRPLGMKGHSIKVSDFMINEKLPRRARQGWPLVCLDDQVVWIPGLRLGHPFRVTSSSYRVVHVSLIRGHNPD